MFRVAARSENFSIFLLLALGISRKFAGVRSTGHWTDARQRYINYFVSFYKLKMAYYKKIHIWDLPTNKVYVRFNEKFREKFFSLARSKFGNFNVAGKFLNIKRADTTLAGDWRKGRCCCPLDLMIKLANEIRIPLSELEKNVEEIKYKTKINKRGGSGGGPIINPKLPIIVGENFAEILGHICGDGSIVTSSPEKGISFKYINSEPTLIEAFKQLVKKVFGEIEPNTQIREKGNYTRPNYCLQYPSILSAFVLSIFNYKPDEKMDIPDFIFKMPRKAKGKFLRAIFDDEASVRINKEVAIGLKPIKPLTHVRMLVEALGIKTSNLSSYRIKSGSMHRFSIGSMRSLKLFNKLVGFKHPTKAKKLNLTINHQRKFERYCNNEPKQRIMNLLLEKNTLKAIEMSRILKRSKSTIDWHLKNMQKEGIITT